MIEDTAIIIYKLDSLHNAAAQCFTLWRVIEWSISAFETVHVADEDAQALPCFLSLVAETLEDVKKFCMLHKSAPQGFTQAATLIRKAATVTDIQTDILKLDALLDALYELRDTLNILGLNLFSLALEDEPDNNCTERVNIQH